MKLRDCLVMELLLNGGTGKVFKDDLYAHYESERDKMMEDVQLFLSSGFIKEVDDGFLLTEEGKKHLIETLKHTDIQNTIGNLKTFLLYPEERRATENIVSYIQQELKKIMHVE